jgi:large repetitive protein
MRINPSSLGIAARRLALPFFAASVISCGGGSDAPPATAPVVPLPPPAEGSFSTAAALAMPRAGHTATLLPNGKVLLVGGSPSWPPTAAVATSAELYDPATNTFSATGSMAFARRGGHAATLLSDGRVLVTGGDDVNVQSAPGRVEAEIYDPNTGRFAPTGPMTMARTSQAAVLLSNGKVLVAGGQNLAGNTAELYDPVTGTFSAAAAPTRYRYSAAGVPLSDGRALVFGYDAAGDAFDVTRSVFNTTGSSQAAGGLWFGPAMALLADGRVFVAGGKEQGPPPSNIALVANARLFDPATNTFSVSGALASPRDRATATRLQDGRVLVFGGEGTTGWPDRGEFFDPRSGQFSPTVPAGAGRYGHTATLLPNGKVLIAGGQSGANSMSGSPAANALLFEVR